MRYRERVDDTDDSDAVLDQSIVGDEEEQHRIQLEHNLQDLSIQLSMSNPSHDSDQETSVEGRSRRRNKSESSYELEYARHNSRPRDISIFHGQNDTHLVQDLDSNFYSYHSIDDGADVHFVGNTVSTPAHHISAVTLSAGLGGRGGRRAYVGESSLSGAEYDPDRPLDSFLNGVAEDLSLLNMDNSMTRRKRSTRRSTAQAPSAPAQVTFDPVIVDHDNSSIGGVDYSFTRAQHTKQPQEHASFEFEREAMPKTKMRVKRPTSNLQPPTPSTRANATVNSSATQGSKFTRMAKSLAKEIEASQRWTSIDDLENEPPTKPINKRQTNQKVDRRPFKDVVNHVASARGRVSAPNADSRPSRYATKTTGARPELPSKHDRSLSKLVCLPDVTGLTSAVASPPRKVQEWRRYSGGSEGERVETELVRTLTTLQTRLNQLESQNLVSRRRVQELERELDVCKLEVKREKTRVMEREEIIVAQQKDFQKRRNALARAAQRIPDPADDERYKEVVEEKKALESLITTLRSHLARLTTELSNQKVQLDELKYLRQHDFQDLREKIAEVDALRSEVERLGGEVEILRGVVEEGLNQRRKAKEDLANSSKDSIAGFTLPLRASDLTAGDETELGNEPSRATIPSPPSRPQSRQQVRVRAHGKGAPLEGELAGLSKRIATIRNGRREKDEVRRTSAKVEECAGDSNVSQGVDASQAEAPPNEERRKAKPSRSSGGQVTKEKECERLRRPEPVAPSQRAETQAQTESPFPEIRGTRLERLFFSAPEHNRKTCRTCQRDRRPNAVEDDIDYPSRLPPRKRVKLSKEDARPRYREEDEIDESVDAGGRRSAKAPFSEDRLPPQTVLVRVLRELEDDFTHYKGIYIELADQYKLMDAASNVAKRNVLADHLREVIDTLEQKGDQIASLYDLLTFQDKPVKESVVPDRKRTSRSPRSPRPLRHYGAKLQGGVRRR